MESSLNRVTLPPMTRLFRGIGLLLVALPIAMAAGSGSEERYLQILLRQPTAETPLERLWQSHQAAGTTEELIQNIEAVDTDQARFLRARVYLLQEQPSEALALLNVLAGGEEPLAGEARRLRFQVQTLSASADRDVRPESLRLLQEDLPERPDAAWRELVLEAGRQWIRQGLPEWTDQAWQLLLDKSSEQAALQRRMATEWLEAGEFERALPFFEQLKDSPDPAVQVRAYQELARWHRNQGDFEPAAAAYREVLRRSAPGHGGRRESVQALVDLYEAEHRLEELERQWLSQAVQRQGDFGVREQLLELYRQTGQSQWKVATLTEMTALRPRDQVLREELARALLEAGYLDQAETEIRSLQRQQPGSLQWRMLLAELLLQTEREEEAGTTLLDWLEQHGDPARAEEVRSFLSRHRLKEHEEKLLRDLAVEDFSWNLRLAGFLMEDGRNSEGDEVLATWLEEDVETTAEVSNWREIINLYRRMARQEAALDLAIRLHETTGRDHALVFELAMAREKYALAETMAREMVGRATNLRQLRQADESLYLALSGAGTEIEPVEPGPETRFRTAVAFPFGQPAAELRNPLLDLEQERIVTEAESDPTADHWLRASWWTARRGDLDRALEQVFAAIDLGDLEESDWDYAIGLAIEHRKMESARTLLERRLKAGQADPAEALRELARLELEEGRVDSAREWLEEARKRGEGNPEMALELADLLGRAGRSQEALELVREFYEEASHGQRGQMLQLKVRLLEQQGRSGVAVELWWERVMEDRELSAFRELTAFAQRRNALPALEQTIRKAREDRSRPDAFLDQAMAEVAFSQGNVEYALTLWKEAIDAGAPAEPIRKRMVEAADQFGLWRAAVEEQERRIRSSSTYQPELEMERARLLEDSFRFHEATRVWEQLVRRAARNAEVLSEGRRFHARRGESQRANRILWKLLELEPFNPEWLLLAAQTEPESPQKLYGQIRKALERQIPVGSSQMPEPPIVGDREARQAYSRVFRLPGEMNDPFVVRAVRVFWQPDQFAAVPGAVPMTPVGLDLIRATGQLLQAHAELAGQRREWIDQWMAWEGGTEALWALYHAGAYPEAMDWVEERLAADPEDLELLQTKLWMGLEGGLFERLIEPLTAPDGDVDLKYRTLLMVAFSQMLAADRVGDVERAVEVFFPSDFASMETLTQASELLATYGHFEAAIELGGRVWEETPTRRAELGLQLAYWQLLMNQPDQSVETLEASLEEPSEQADLPFYDVLSRLFPLLDPESLARLEEVLLADPDLPMLDRKTRATLLAALHGDTGKAARLGIELVRMRPTPDSRGGSFLDRPVSGDYRYWNYIYNLGQRLADFGAATAALAVWNEALADSAFLMLQDGGTESVAREIRLHSLLLELLQLPPNEQERLVRELARGDAVPKESLGALLESRGLHRLRGVYLEERLRRGLSGAEVLQAAVNSFQAAGETKALVELAEFLMQQEWNREEQSSVTETLRRIAAILESSGQPLWAGAILEAALERDPDAKPLRRQFAELAMELEVAGLATELLADIDSDSSPDLLRARARADQQLERPNEALTLFKTLQERHVQVFPGNEYEYVKALILAGEREEAAAMARRLIAGGEPRLVRHLIRQTRQLGELDLARQWLGLAWRAAGSEEDSFELLMQFLPGSGPDFREDVDLQELWRLARVAAGQHPGRVRRLYQLREAELSSEIVWQLLEEEQAGNDLFAALEQARLLSAEDPGAAGELVARLARDFRVESPHYPVLSGFLEQQGQWSVLNPLATEFSEREPLETLYRLDRFRSEEDSDLKALQGETLLALAFFEPELEGRVLEVLEGAEWEDPRVFNLRERYATRRQAEDGRRFERLARQAAAQDRPALARFWIEQVSRTPWRSDPEQTAALLDSIDGWTPELEAWLEGGLWTGERRGSEGPWERFQWDGTDAAALENYTEWLLEKAGLEAALTGLLAQGLSLENRLLLSRHMAVGMAMEWLEDAEARAEVEAVLPELLLQITRLAPENWPMIARATNWAMEVGATDIAKEILLRYLETGRDPIGRSEAARRLAEFGE